LPAVVWAEDVVPPSAAGLLGLAQLSFAQYAPQPPFALSAAVEVDRLALSSADPREASMVASAAAGGILYLGPMGGAAFGAGADLNHAPFVPDPPIPPFPRATLLLSNASGFEVREDKARLLVADAGGLLMTALLLPPGQPIGLATLLDRVMVGTVSGIGGGFPATNLFGFTPDGDHAWAVMDVGGDPGLLGLGLGALYTLDLLFGTRANLGPIALPLASQARSVAPGSFRDAPCFLAGGNVAFGAAPLDLSNRTVFDLFAAVRSPGPRRVDLGAFAPSPPFQLSVPALGAPDRWLLCAASQDGNEARLVANAPLGTTGDFEWDVVAGPSQHPVPGRLLATLLSQPATVSPFGAPFLDEWDVLAMARPSGRFLTTFKVWGAWQQNGGKWWPFLDVITGFVPVGPAFPATATTESNTALLLSLPEPGDPGGSYVFQAPLTSRAPPVPPLP
jgi:hypothetical protein